MGTKRIETYTLVGTDSEIKRFEETILGTMADQDADGVEISGGEITGTAVGTFAESLALTADTGSAQADATQLVRGLNNISTCGTAGDSVLLPALADMLPGEPVIVVNNGAESSDVFPATGETIAGKSANAAQAVAAGKGAIFYAGPAAWYVVVGA